MSMTSPTDGENPEDCGVYNEYYNVQHGILSEFTCEGLDGHNNSLSWIEANANRMGATINTRPSSRRWSQLEAFEIFVKGRESGIKYKITAYYAPKQAALMARRMSEIDLNEGNAPQALRVFRKMMHFDVNWYDHRDGEWEHICLDEVHDPLRPHWPGDAIVSVMNALHDDLASAVDIHMMTLRRGMISALPVYWFSGEMVQNPSFDMMANYVSNLQRLEESNSKEELIERAEGLVTSFIDEEE